MSETRYLWKQASQVAEYLRAVLLPACTRIEIAGSLRRMKSDVGDIEILYISRKEEQNNPDNFFATRTVDVVDVIIKSLIIRGVFELRKSVTGRTAYGPLNKLMRHTASGIPVDLFAATEENWFNYLVCRTGPADLNKRICSAAIAKGWHWMPYGAGFKTEFAPPIQEFHAVHSEREVFEFVGLPYVDPEERK